MNLIFSCSVVEKWRSFVPLHWASVATATTLLLGILRTVFGHVSLYFADETKTFSQVSLLVFTSLTTRSAEVWASVISEAVVSSIISETIVSRW